MISDEISKQNLESIPNRNPYPYPEKVDAFKSCFKKQHMLWMIENATIEVDILGFNFNHIRDVNNLEFINCHFIGNNLNIVASYAKNEKQEPTEYRTNIKFESCTFEMPVSLSGDFEDVVFYCPLPDKRNDDKRCKFKQKLKIHGNFRQLKLENIEINKLLQIQNAVVSSNFKISDVIFYNQCSIISNNFKNLCIENVRFIDGNFNITGVLLFNANEIKNDVLIKNIKVEYEKDFEIIDNVFNGNCSLENIKATTLCIDINSLNPKKRLNIFNIFDKKNIRIDKLIFNRLPPRTYLENLNVVELDLSRNTIEDKEILSLINLKINLLKIENFINYGFFTINNFKPNEDDKIEISNSTLGKLDLVSCDLSKVDIQIDNAKLVDIFYTDTVFPNEIGSSKEDAKAKLEQQRDTYGQFKVVSEKVGNRFEALRFQAKEMTAYYESIKSAEKKNYILEKIYNFFKSIQIWVSNKFWKEERIILFVMKYSNNFRQSWVRGVLFTFLVGLIPFIGFIWSLENTVWCFDSKDCICETLKIFGYYFEFLNPAHKTDFLKEHNNYRAGAYFFDFIGRILIGFGIYQTIQAFRKFGKE